MYKKILAPLDGSRTSEAILDHVVGLAQLSGAAIYLLEVLEPLPQHAAVGAPSLLAEGANQRATGVRHYVSEQADQLRARGFTVEPLVRRGGVVDMIVRTAEELQVDLIAMASHGATGFARFIYGSVAADVLHRTTVPMLILRVEPNEN